MKLALVYPLAALAEIGGCFAFWAWLKLDRSPPGVACLNTTPYFFFRHPPARSDRGTQRRRRRCVRRTMLKRYSPRQVRAPARRWVPRSAPRRRGLPEDDEK
ncbi:hypothetical protein QE389_002534 [Brevundimonas sp. SORGH_AS 993]|nr:hypothetical protein [Brevundimonas sp. SORGH_AS_0993]